MPLPISLAHRLAERLASRAPRRRGQLPAPRRQDPGLGPLPGRQAGRDREAADLHPARRGRRVADPPTTSGSTSCMPILPEELYDATSLRKRLPRQPDRQLRHRRPRGRLRAHRSQDHRRHLRRHGPPRRRRLLGQGPVEGRPLGRLRGPLRGQERRGRRARRPLRGPGRLRDRRRAPGLGDGRDLRHREDRPRPRSTSWSTSTSTCARAPSASTSTCTGRSTRRRRPTATSAARTTTSPGSGPTRPTCCARTAGRSAPPRPSKPVGAHAEHLGPRRRRP